MVCCDGWGAVIEPFEEPSSVTRHGSSWIDGEDEVACPGPWPTPDWARLHSACGTSRKTDSVPTTRRAVSSYPESFVTITVLVGLDGLVGIGRLFVIRYLVRTAGTVYQSISVVGGGHF